MPGRGSQSPRSQSASQRLQEEFRKWEGEIRRRGALANMASGDMSTDVLSPQTPILRGPGRSLIATNDSTSRYERFWTGQSCWSSASAQSSSTKSTQTLSMPKPTGPAIPTPEATSSTPNPPITEAKGVNTTRDKSERGTESVAR